MKLHVLAVTSVLSLTSIAMLCSGSAFAAGDANESSCPNEASSSFRPYLSDCRAYELVTPPYKENGGLWSTGISADGDVIAGIGGAFAGSESFWFQVNRNPNMNVYKFTRTASGWLTQSLTPPATEFSHSVLMAATEGATESIWGVATNELSLNEDIYMRDSNGAFRPVGPGTGPEIRDENLTRIENELSFAGGSEDMSHSLYQLRAFATAEVEGHKGHNNLWPGDTSLPEAASLYEYDYSGREDVEPLLVGISNDERLKNNREAKLISNCGTELASATGASNAISRLGTTVYFVAEHEDSVATCESPAVNELYARVGSEHTVPISEPELAACSSCDTKPADRKPARFVGASSDGQRAFFLTEQDLLGTDTGLQLYEYDNFASQATPERPEGKLRLVSTGSSTPEVQGVVNVSEDGSHVYFVARGVLAGANREGRSPEPGADNLYVDESAGEGRRLVFVATLLNSEEEATLEAEEAAEHQTVTEVAEKAGSVAFEEALSKGESFGEAIEASTIAESKSIEEHSGALGPTGTLAADKAVWTSERGRPAQTNPAGDHLLFQTSASLVSGDTASVPQVFEYDAETGEIAWVSKPTDALLVGTHLTIFDQSSAVPDATAPLVAYKEHGAISDGGEIAAFTSGARLTPQVENPNSPNVFEYRAGAVSLVSDGKDVSKSDGAPAVALLGMDGTGEDLMFSTADVLVSGAAPTQVAVYDARQSGGFVSQALNNSCQGEACRGPLASSQPGVSPNSEESHEPEVLLRPPASKVTVHLTKKQLLKRALAPCRRIRSRRQRIKCQAKAKRRYGSSAKVSDGVGINKLKGDS